MKKIIRTTLPQTKETKIQLKECEGFDIYCAYSRKNERISDDSIGEDYLVFQQNGERLSVALCDGVGSSFMPHLVSELLGQNIIKWIWRFQEDSLAKDEIENSFRNFLNDLSGEQSDPINQHALSDKYGRRSVIAQEIKREKGGESVFISCLIDKGLDFALFIWMGDSRIYIRDRNDEIVEPFNELLENVLLRNNDQVVDFWSTKKGAVGDLNIFRTRLSELSMISIYSDGLKRLDTYQNSYPDHESIQILIDNQFYAPDSDDISFIEIINKPYIKKLDERHNLNLPIKNVLVPPSDQKKLEEGVATKPSEVSRVSNEASSEEEQISQEMSQQLRFDKEELEGELQMIHNENDLFRFLARSDPQIIEENEDKSIFRYTSGSKSIDILLRKNVDQNSVGEIYIKTVDRGISSDWSKPLKVHKLKREKRTQIVFIIALIMSLLLNFWFFGSFIYNLIRPSTIEPIETPTVTATHFVTDTPRPTLTTLPTQELFMPFKTEILDTTIETQAATQPGYPIYLESVAPIDTETIPEPTSTSIFVSPDLY